MGRVLLAHDPVLDREVALKHLRDDLRIPRDVRDGLVIRMRHEARAAARVTHPNIVTLHDMGEDPGLGMYLVFEYVEGPTLKERLYDGPLSPQQAARLARELGEALTLAHKAGVVHRDVKPENIILASTGGKVADFGIARIPDSTLTHQGGLMGTPAYSAPETFKAGRFSPASDQFSLAAVMYEATSGERAFPGDDAVTVTARIAHESPEAVGKQLGCPALDDVLARGLAKRPEDRYPSCEAFGHALALALEGVPGFRAQGFPAAAPSSPGQGSDPRLAAFPGGREAMPSGLVDTGSSGLRTDSSFPQRDRKLGQVILGGAVIVVTAMLLLRTALRSVDGSDASPAAEETSATVATASTAPTVQARPPSPTKVTRPRVDPATSTGGRPSTDAELDAGVPPDAQGSATGSEDGTEAAGENDAPTPPPDPASSVDATGGDVPSDLVERR
ncbi:protein kinase [Chondromyces crocatus]|uniref:Protein kinase n=2 Tax=Chondromyces crocatus TaxID=52 RepID=A0A0K1EGI4_CHOCO|nr:protein kinase [Chondromyces crocatus]